MDHTAEFEQIRTKVKQRQAAIERQICARLNARAHPAPWADNIPEIVRSYCAGYNVKYCGHYRDYDAYAVKFKPPRDSYAYDTCIIGFPTYVLVKPGSSELMQISDINFAITNELHLQDMDSSDQAAKECLVFSSPLPELYAIPKTPEPGEGRLTRAQRAQKMSEQIQRETEALAAKGKRPYVWADDIPENIRQFCDGYKVEYCGVYEGQDVYSVSLRAPEDSIFDFSDDICYCGFPCYVLDPRDGSNKLIQVSDHDFKISKAVAAQLEQLRAAGHPKRTN